MIPKPVISVISILESEKIPVDNRNKMRHIETRNRLNSSY